MKFGQLRRATEGMKQAGYSKEDRRELLTDSEAAREEFKGLVEDSPLKPLVRRETIDAFLGLASGDNGSEDPKKLIEVGNVLYEMAKDKYSEGKNRGDTYITKGEVKLMAQAVGVIEGGFFKGHLSEISGDKATMAAFLLNRMAKIVEGMPDKAKDYFEECLGTGAEKLQEVVDAAALGIEESFDIGSLLRENLKEHVWILRDEVGKGRGTEDMKKFVAEYEQVEGEKSLLMGDGGELDVYLKELRRGLEDILDKVDILLPDTLERQRVANVIENTLEQLQGNGIDNMVNAMSHADTQSSIIESIPHYEGDTKILQRFTKTLEGIGSQPRSSKKQGGKMSLADFQQTKKRDYATDEVKDAVKKLISSPDGALAQMIELAKKQNAMLEKAHYRFSDVYSAGLSHSVRERIEKLGLEYSELHDWWYYDEGIHNKLDNVGREVEGSARSVQRALSNARGPENLLYFLKTVVIASDMMKREQKPTLLFEKTGKEGHVSMQDRFSTPGERRPTHMFLPKWWYKQGGRAVTKEEKERIEEAHWEPGYGSDLPDDAFEKITNSRDLRNQFGYSDVHYRSDHLPFAKFMIGYMRKRKMEHSFVPNVETNDSTAD